MLNAGKHLSAILWEADAALAAVGLGVV